MESTIPTEQNNAYQPYVDLESTWVGAYTYLKCETNNYSIEEFCEKVKLSKSSFYRYVRNFDFMKNKANSFLKEGRKFYSDYLLNSQKKSFRDLIFFFFNSFKKFKNQIRFYLYYQSLMDFQNEEARTEYESIIKSIDRIYKKSKKSKQIYFTLISKSIFKLFEIIAKNNIKNVLEGGVCKIPKPSFIFKIFEKYTHKNGNYFIPD